MSRGDAWTDERLDDLNARVRDQGQRMDAGFVRLDERITQVERRMDAGFSELRSEMSETNKRINSVQRTMVQAVIGMTAAMFAGFGGLAALIATQI